MQRVLDLITNHITCSGIKHRLQKARNGTLNKIIHIVPHAQLLYIPIPKAANTSIIKVLWEAQGVVVNGGVHSNIRKKPVPMLSSFSNAEINDILKNKDWFKFTFVRNPYTRLISCYKNKILNPKANVRENFLAKLQWKEQEAPTFLQFVTQLSNPEILLADSHWKPQYILIMTELVTLDFIGKIEHFNEDIVIILDRLGVNNHDLRQQALVPQNKTEASLTQLNPESVQIINQIYSDDFSYFNYEKK